MHEGHISDPCMVATEFMKRKDLISIPYFYIQRGLKI